MSREHDPILLGLFAALLQTGGIERVSRLIASILQDVAASRGYQCELLSLSDKPGINRFRIGSREYLVRGFGRDKLRFSLSALEVTSRVRLAYIAHPNLAPLGLFLRFLNPRLQYWVAAYGVEVWHPLSTLRRLALRSAKVVTALSDFTAARMIEVQKLDPRNVIVLPPALDPDLTGHNATSRSNLGFTAGSLVILTVARLIASEPGKGVDMVIRALPRVAREFPNVLYVIVGEGDYRPILQELGKKIGVFDRIIFVGEIGDDDLIEYYRRADIFAMPSRQEGFGVAFLEAMAFGKPVIGGNHGGTPEVVEDGVTGYLVEFGDVNTLADRLIRLLQDHVLRSNMGLTARRRVEEKYTFDRLRDRIVPALTIGLQSL